MRGDRVFPGGSPITFQANGHVTTCILKSVNPQNERAGASLLTNLQASYHKHPLSGTIFSTSEGARLYWTLRIYLTGLTILTKHKPTILGFRFMEIVWRTPQKGLFFGSPTQLHTFSTPFSVESADAHCSAAAFALLSPSKSFCKSWNDGSVADREGGQEGKEIPNIALGGVVVVNL